MDVREFLDPEGKTVAKPFNFLSLIRPERLKDRREGQKRESVDHSSSVRFVNKDISSVVPIKHR